MKVWSQDERRALLDGNEGRLLGQHGVGRSVAVDAEGHALEEATNEELIGRDLKKER